MSEVPRDILLRIQDRCYGRLLAHPWLADVAIIKEERALTEAEMKKQMGVLRGRSGKVGVCVYVQRPIAQPESDNAAARSQIIQAFTVLEHPTINAQSNGTHKTAQEVAIEIFDLFQLAAAATSVQVFSGFPGGSIVPDNGFEELNGWEVRFQTFTGLRRTARVGTPLIDPDAGAVPQTVTLTCGTADAAIYYTLDGSYPSSANPTAQLYAAPFEVTTPAILCTAAEKVGLQQSNIAEAAFN